MCKPRNECKMGLELIHFNFLLMEWHCISVATLCIIDQIKLCTARVITLELKKHVYQYLFFLKNVIQMGKLFQRENYASLNMQLSDQAKSLYKPVLEFRGSLQAITITQDVPRKMTISIQYATSLFHVPVALLGCLWTSCSGSADRGSDALQVRTDQSEGAISFRYVLYRNAE